MAEALRATTLIPNQTNTSYPKASGSHHDRGRPARKGPRRSQAAISSLSHERDVIGVGTEPVGTDAGQGATFSQPNPCHYYMHGSNKFGLSSLVTAPECDRPAARLAHELQINRGP